MNLRFSLRAILFLSLAAFLFASCSTVRYSYYNKHKVPYSAPEEAKLPKAIPAKPFLTQTETALRQSQPPVQEKITAKNQAPDKEAKTEITNQKEQKKVAGDFDIAKYLREHKHEISARDGSNIDHRTLMIVLLVVLILVLLALIGNGILWLLWVALLVLLIYALLKYLDLIG